MSDWTCDLCGAFILAGFEAQHEWWHREIRRGQRVTFTPAPSQLPAPQFAQSVGPNKYNPVSSGPPFDAGVLTNDKFRELFGIEKRGPEFRTVQDIEDYLNER